MYVYVLQLSHDKLYVGKTTDLAKELNMYFTRIYTISVPNQWINMYNPVSIHTIFSVPDNFVLDQYVIKLMKEYGVNNVRGGSFSTVSLSTDDVFNIMNSVIDTITSTSSDTDIVINMEIDNSDHIMSLLFDSCDCENFGGDIIGQQHNKHKNDVKVKYIHSTTCPKTYELFCLILGKELNSYLVKLAINYKRYIFVIGKYNMIMIYHRTNEYIKTKSVLSYSLTTEGGGIIYNKEPINTYDTCINIMRKNRNIRCEEIDKCNEVFFLYDSNDPIDCSNVINLYQLR